jgi:hypothetical protein
MRKSILVVLVVLLGVYLVLSMDGDPPRDEHLILDEGPVPAEGNGFRDLLSMLETMDWPDDDAWIHETPHREIPENKAILDLVARNRDVLDGVSEVVAAPVFRIPLIADLVPGEYVDRVRRLGHLVGIDATIRMREQDEEEAFERLFQYLTLGQRFQRSGDMLHYLLGGSCKEVAMQQIVRLAADSDGEKLGGLADRLGDAGWERDAMENALRREYVLENALLEKTFEQAGGWGDLPVLRRLLYQPNRTRKMYADDFTACMTSLSEDCAATPHRNGAILDRTR